MFDAKILADSIAQGVRLTTLQVTFPRIVLAEFNTHRVMSRNSASSRAIPVEKRIVEVRQDPFIPEDFASNKKGMQAGDSLGGEDQERARMAWLDAAQQAIKHAGILADVGVHKQWANRLLEPFAWHTVICTATEWDNFYALRCNPQAQPEIRRAAELMRDAMAGSKPVEIQPGDWHLPLVDHTMGDEVFARSQEGVMTLVKLSVARCARVSYLTHDGLRDVKADLTLHDRLLTSGHMSPFEHAARVALPEDRQHMSYGHTTDAGDQVWWCGNFRAPWVQYRKMVPGEAVFNGR